MSSTTSVLLFGASLLNEDMHVMDEARLPPIKEVFLGLKMREV